MAQERSDGEAGGPDDGRVEARGNGPGQGRGQERGQERGQGRGDGRIDGVGAGLAQSALPPGARRAPLKGVRLWAVRLAGLALVVLSACGLAVRGTGHDPAVWHVDPATAERTGKPNDYLAAPPGTTAAAADRTAVAADPVAALAAFDWVALAAPRVEVVAGSAAEGFVTYVQTSRIVGFPDYVSARTVEGGIAVWSRSRYGYSDLGVNRARVEDWLAAAGL